MVCCEQKPAYIYVKDRPVVLVSMPAVAALSEPGNDDASLVIDWLSAALRFNAM